MVSLRALPLGVFSAAFPTLLASCSDNILLLEVPVLGVFLAAVCFGLCADSRSALLLGAVLLGGCRLVGGVVLLLIINSCLQPNYLNVG